MVGLEYMLLFGVPGNKLELIDGQSRCAFPFLERDDAEAHFQEWLTTLCRWKGVERPAVDRRDPKQWLAHCAGFTVEQHPLPIVMRVPLDFELFLSCHRTPWRRDLWPGQPTGRETGWDSFLTDGDVRMQLFRLFDDLCHPRGGLHCGRVDVVLSDRSVVAPDEVAYLKPRAECMIADDYFRGPPGLVAEVMIPASRAMDRGPRKDLYRKAGVPHLWLIEPELETVEVLALAGRDYQTTGVYGAGDSFRPALFPEHLVEVDKLFDTQMKRHGQRPERGPSEPVPTWLAPQEQKLGLEYLFLLGHPDRRWEIWNNRAPSVLAFGSSTEAKARLGHFLVEAGRWEQMPVPRAVSVDDDADMAEVGRFQFTRRGRHVWLDVAVDARKYRHLLEVTANRAAWDWGED